ncbi:beta-galactosidase/beta-glucuronidase [Pedobacter sp. CAN_A7]|uniref:glycoside hydrolase family 2 protein n=1 Tax=Pedobacter sp. CAN_A7 TaxID=2787722 RepID=UPI0018CAE933
MDIDINHPNYSLTKHILDNDEGETYVNPLPRAVIRPNSFLLLDGSWRFSPDPENLGIKDLWYINHDFKNEANWPGSVETHLSKSNPNGEYWKDKIVVWYEREFPLPKLSDDAKCPRSQLQLTFGACGYKTRVWLNGIPLKTIEGEWVHVGSNTSFTYELDEQVLQENNRLTVRIAATMDADTARGKQESSVYKRGGIWYQTYSGGVRSIWLETVEKNRLRSRIGVVSMIEENLVRFNFTTRIHDPGDYLIRLKVYHHKQDHHTPIATDEYPLKLKKGQREQRLVMEIPNAENWSPASPHLYRLVAQLVDENGNASEIEAKFGIRKIEARGPHIYLNNERTYLNGILYQPGVANYEEIKRHMHAMKRLGCNMVRIHIAGVDPRIYNLADKIGLLLWVEVPSPHRSTEKSRKNHKNELLKMLALMGTHPSIMIWSLYNEDWGAQDVASNLKTRQYMMDMYHYMKLAHPQFLVVDNDGWHHLSYRGRLKTDLLTVHLYTPELDRWKQLLNQLMQGQMDGVAAFPIVVGDPFFYRKQAPLLVSEWGGFGFADYGGPKDNEERASQIRLFKKELRDRSFAGDVYTQATNIEEERNGIIDFGTGELKVPDGLFNAEDQTNL